MIRLPHGVAVQHSRRTRPLLAAFLGLICVLASETGPARAETAAEFYAGKTIRIQVGYGVGGGYDIVARLFGRFIGAYIPGKPTVVIQNVPGGGSLNVANALYNSVAKDGLTLGVFAFDVALEPYYGEKRAQFDPAKFAWIGSMDTDFPFCGVWKGAGAGIRRLPDLLTAKNTVTFGASAHGTLPSGYALFLKNALGAPVNVVTGYTGTKEIVLAMERGEVHGSCALFESLLRSSFKDYVDRGDLQVLMLASLGKPSPSFPDATPVMDAVSSDEMRQSARLIFSPAGITRPLAAPPGTPPERIAALREALIASVRDPEMIKAAQAQMISLQIKTHSEIEAVLTDFQSASPEAVRKARAYTRE